MGLNCKPGDLAIVVRSVCGNEGKNVRCLHLATDDEANEITEGRVWKIDRELLALSEIGTIRRSAFCEDDILRPIRPLDELDDISRDEEVTA